MTKDIINEVWSYPTQPSTSPSMTIPELIAEARADERKKLLKEITEIRDLKQSEKGKSLDYWEGYTSAVVKMVKKL